MVLSLQVDNLENSLTLSLLGTNQSNPSNKHQTIEINDESDVVFTSEFFIMAQEIIRKEVNEYV